jgi:NAD(P)-dependent dehydrogenase (short-subunit alcohol dehydrogenase family)
MSRQTRVRGTAGQWTEAEVPDQSGRTAVITGGNSGIGFEAVRVLAGRGARLILGCRDQGKAHDAVTRIRAAAPGADVRVVPLDLASLESVRVAAGQIRSACEGIDLLINNAGVMMPPYGRTADGFELQFGINHLGHFALTGLLIDRLAALPGARVVTVSSNGHAGGHINFDDLQSERGYRREAGYGQSKLANLMFTYELQRRLESAGSPAIAVAAHPGLTRTDLARYLSRVMTAFYVLVERPLAQRAAIGALGTLRAATDPAVHGGEYYGPVRWRGERGYPERISSSERSHDEGAQRRLWQESERLTGVRYAI